MTVIFTCRSCQGCLSHDEAGKPWDPCPHCGHIRMTDPDEIAKFKQQNRREYERLVAIRQTPSPSGLQLDLLTAVRRLEQVSDELVLAGSLVASRLITCDLPRLREHLTPETLAWEAEQ